MSSATVQIVWFKRDLRLRDHRPLVEAVRRGPVVPLYVVEQSVVDAPDFGERHWRFVRDALVNLDTALRLRGTRLVVEQGEVIDVLEKWRQKLGQFALWSHEETGNAVTFARDRAVAQWVRSFGIEWNEYPQNGVVRRLSHRNGWARQWQERMTEPLLSAPERLPPPFAFDAAAHTFLPAASDLRLVPSTHAAPINASERSAETTLRDFLMYRGRRYSREMSSPVTAYAACSRLSAHLAWGTIAMRRVV
jgi:deoxyribodipyrimidine photo-lyase